MHAPGAGPHGEVVWEPCGHCWGQREILVPVRGARGVRRLRCPACLGVGQRAVVTGGARRRASAPAGPPA